MELLEVTSPDQFEEYYKGIPGLEDPKNIEARIKNIKEVTGITAARHCHGAKLEDVLIGLEDSVIHGSWRDFD